MAKILMRFFRGGPMVLMILALTTATPALALFGSSESASNRTSHPLGAYLTLFGDPYPAQYGVNVAYNVYDFLRINAGAGTNSKQTATLNSFGGGLKLLIPGLPLTPVAGVNWAAANVSGGQPVAIKGFSASGSHFYVNAGIDWQTKLGFMLGAGYNHSLRAGVEDAIYINAGFFL